MTLKFDSGHPLWQNVPVVREVWVIGILITCVFGQTSHANCGAAFRASQALVVLDGSGAPFGARIVAAKAKKRKGSHLRELALKARSTVLDEAEIQLVMDTAPDSLGTTLTEAIGAGRARALEEGRSEAFELALSDFAGRLAENMRKEDAITKEPIRLLREEIEEGHIISRLREGSLEFAERASRFLPEAFFKGEAFLRELFDKAVVNKGGRLLPRETLALPEFKEIIDLLEIPQEVRGRLNTAVYDRIREHGDEAQRSLSYFFGLVAGLRNSPEHMEWLGEFLGSPGVYLALTTKSSELAALIPPTVELQIRVGKLDSIYQSSPSI